jgi:GntR family transcriptional repressor for pyruvate dehydrogenase complex
MSDRVAEQVRNFIVEEGLAEGERLPSERRLAELVGSSRPTVSQALRSLAVLGLIEIRPGAGAFVLRRPSSMLDTGMELMLGLEPDSIAEAAHLRFLLEWVAGRQALARGPAGLGALEQAFEHLRAAQGSAAEWIAADVVFHVEFVRLAGNRYLTSLFTSTHTAVLNRAYKQWVTSGTVPYWLQENQFVQQIALHEPIIDALHRGKRKELQRALVQHQEALLEHMDVKLLRWQDAF